MTVKELLDHCVNSVIDDFKITLRKVNTHSRLGRFSVEDIKKIGCYSEAEVDLFFFSNDRLLDIYIILDK